MSLEKRNSSDYHGLSATQLLKVYYGWHRQSSTHLQWGLCSWHGDGGDGGEEQRRPPCYRHYSP